MQHRNIESQNSFEIKKRKLENSPKLRIYVM